MEERTYFISEVSKLVGVEPHVLRYWEEELEVSIPRNSQGKRCYSVQDVEWFREVKHWKDKGMQLKAVKELLGDRDNLFGGEPQESSGDKAEFEQEEPGTEFSIVTIEEPSDSMKLFEQLLDGMIGRALEKNNEKLVQEICDAILQELDEKLETRMESLIQQELMQEMLREGQRESAAAMSGERKSLWKKWKKWLERYI